MKRISLWFLFFSFSQLSDLTNAERCRWMQSSWKEKYILDDCLFNERDRREERCISQEILAQSIRRLSVWLASPFGLKNLASKKSFGSRFWKVYRENYFWRNIHFDRTNTNLVAFTKISIICAVSEQKPDKTTIEVTLNSQTTKLEGNNWKKMTRRLKEASVNEDANSWSRCLSQDTALVQTRR